MQEIAIAIIGSGALSALVSGIVAIINGRQKSKKGIDKALKFLILGELERQFDKLHQKGRCSRTDMKRFREVYDTYKSLGGDGYADDMLEAIKELEVSNG